MKIKYRGVSYEYNPPAVEYGDLSQSGKYRGLDVRFRNPKKVPVLQPTLDLLYRGTAYTANPVEVKDAIESTEVDAPEVAATINAPASSIQDRARVLMMNHHRKVKQRQQAMLSRLDARVGLSGDEAGRYWNHIQGKVHPSFGDSYDRSHAALS
ncbi:DUF4278 domain-containing protein [Thermocoleostomius sinensis]|jgi:hypothetical protein|uniref:DUF4278 domain-containing protein n=1 Tax=Thermocoleostomius sinensis A174 TaxID=2016057 RepID=A0A9E8ZEN7_9CYAN|nr:DUF4278 domain-containing protein [Thermocoleostomius sinensis]WAL61627.1 DUF4278 domain-containing protein [Thermocoleostomius sinensis A174]